MDVVASLSQLPILQGFSTDQLRALAASGSTRRMAAGATVFRQGDAPDGLFVILSGTVDVSLTEQDQEVPLAQLMIGDVFGEMALIDGQPRSATVTCRDDAEFLVLGRREFLELVRSSATLFESLLSDLSGRVRRAQDRFYQELLQRQAVQSQMEIERHRALAELVAGVAHEVNTPLGIVNSAASVISENLNQSALRNVGSGDVRELLDDSREAARLIESNIARASELIQRFKNLSFHHASSQPERVRIAECVYETVSLYAIEAKRTKLDLQLICQVADTAEWFGSPGELSQILLNLLTNAARYAYPDGRGGRVEVILSALPEASPRDYELTVRDFGSGIPPEIQPRIFEPFFTTGRSLGGTGLGLSIVDALVRQSLQGTLRFTSCSGLTDFVIEFPAETK